MKPYASLRLLLAASMGFALTQCIATSALPASALLTQNPRQKKPQGYLALSLSYNSTSEINRDWVLKVKVKNTRTNAIRTYAVRSESLRGISGEPVLLPVPNGEWAVQPVFEFAVEPKVVNGTTWNGSSTPLELQSDPFLPAQVASGKIFHLGFLSISSDEASISSTHYRQKIQFQFTPFAHVPAALWDYDLKRSTHTFQIYESTKVGFREQTPFEILSSASFQPPQAGNRTVQFFGPKPFSVFLVVKSGSSEKRVRIHSTSLATPITPIQMANIELKPDETYEFEGSCTKELACLTHEVNLSSGSDKQNLKFTLTNRLEWGELILPLEKLDLEPFVKSLTLVLRPYLANVETPSPSNPPKSNMRWTFQSQKKGALEEQDAFVIAVAPCLKSLESRDKVHLHIEAMDGLAILQNNTTFGLSGSEFFRLQSCLNDNKSRLIDTLVAAGSVQIEPSKPAPVPTPSVVY